MTTYISIINPEVFIHILWIIIIYIAVRISILAKKELKVLWTLTGIIILGYATFLKYTIFSTYTDGIYFLSGWAIMGLIGLIGTFFVAWGIYRLFKQ